MICFGTENTKNTNFYGCSNSTHGKCEDEVSVFLVYSVPSMINHDKLEGNL